MHGNRNQIISRDKQSKCTQLFKIFLQLPQHIATNIIQLTEKWRTDRSVESALAKNQIYDEKQHQEMIKDKMELAQEARLSYMNYLELYKFYKTQFIDHGKARGLVTNLIALMTVNWIFLFGVTYGKYGWDTGEPLSYLTTLAVQLMAMMGIFQMDSIIQKTGKDDFQNISLMMNLESLLRMREFVISYSKRNL